MSIELVTGYAGKPHVTSGADGLRNASLVGTESYVTELLDKFACSVVTANQVTVASGMAYVNGRQVLAESPTDIAIDSGTQASGRHDIIAIKYSRDADTGVESAAFEVIKGTATADTPTDPEVPSGDVIAGALEAYLPLWRIVIDGVTVGEPEALFAAHSGVVTVTGEQEIEGKKTFAGGIDVTGAFKFAGNSTVIDEKVTSLKTVSFNRYGNGFYIKDSGGANVLAYLRDAFESDAKQGLQLEAIATIGGTIYCNTLDMFINQNTGAKTVYVSAPEAWRNALGASSGTWPIGIGGTGATSVAGARRALLPVTCLASGKSVTNGGSLTVSDLSQWKLLVFGVDATNSTSQTGIMCFGAVIGSSIRLVGGSDDDGNGFCFVGTISVSGNTLKVSHLARQQVGVSSPTSKQAYLHCVYGLI